MAFTEDLNLFFDECEGFAVEAVFSRAGNEIAACQVILDVPTEYVNFETVSVAADAPYCTAKTVDMVSVRRNDIVLIEDLQFKVAQIKHDGTGITRVDLELY